MESIEKCQVSSRAVGSLKGAEGGRLLKAVVQQFREAGLDLSLFNAVPTDSN